MQLFRSWQHLATASAFKGCVLTIGNFDGVHLGHQHLIQQLQAQAKQRTAPSLVLTFHPHPRSLFNPQHTSKKLLSLHDRLAQLQETGVDAVLVLPFTHALAKLSPAQFMHRLYQSCQMQHMHVGHDFAFGKNRSGHWQALQEIGQKMGFSTSKADAFCLHGKIVSSSMIRQAICNADFHQVQSLLGRPYNISGHVGSGDKRGRDLGFRTANMRLQHYCHPPEGIYAVWAYNAHEHWQGAAYIGYRPTFAGQDLRLETTLLDAQPNLYRQRLHIQFVQKIRDDITYSNAQSLSQQIALDCQQAREILKVNAF